MTVPSANDMLHGPHTTCTACKLHAAQKPCQRTCAPCYFSHHNARLRCPRCSPHDNTRVRPSSLGNCVNADLPSHVSTSRSRTRFKPNAPVAASICRCTNTWSASVVVPRWTAPCSWTDWDRTGGTSPCGWLGRWMFDLRRRSCSVVRLEQKQRRRGLPLSHRQ